MPDVTVVDAVLVETPGGAREWSCVVEVDGKTLAYYFPEDTLAIRAAEYGFDPDLDRDELLDIVIHEPFVAQSPDAHRHPRHLHNNPDQADARAYLREQMAGRGRVRTRARRPGEGRPGRASDARVVLDADVEPGTTLDVLRRALPSRSDRAREVGERIDAARDRARLARNPRQGA